MSGEDKREAAARALVALRALGLHRLVGPAALDAVDAITAHVLDVARAEAQGRALVGAPLAESAPREEKKRGRAKADPLGDPLGMPFRRRDAIGNWYEVERGVRGQLLLRIDGHARLDGGPRCLDPVRARELASLLHAWASEEEAGR